MPFALLIRDMLFSRTSLLRRVDDGFVHEADILNHWTTSP